MIPFAFPRLNGVNTITGGVNDNVALVTSALNTVNALNTALGALPGTNVTISSNTTINASSGPLDEPVTIPQQADLALAKTVSNATPNVNDAIIYTVTLSNLGPDAATNAQVFDLLPAGVAFGSAAPGANVPPGTSADHSSQRAPLTDLSPPPRGSHSWAKFGNLDTTAARDADETDRGLSG